MKVIHYTNDTTVKKHFHFQIFLKLFCDLKITTI
jgi:hypothetical protein